MFATLYFFMVFIWRVVKSNILCGLFQHKSDVTSISPNTIPMLSLSTISKTIAPSFINSPSAIDLDQFQTLFLSDPSHFLSFVKIWYFQLLTNSQLSPSTISKISVPSFYQFSLCNRFRLISDFFLSDIN